MSTKGTADRMDTEINYYRGYRIVMERHGSGWRAMIYPPNTTPGIPGPESNDSISHKGLLDEAKRLIDRHAV